MCYSVNAVDIVNVNCVNATGQLILEVDSPQQSLCQRRQHKGWQEMNAVLQPGQWDVRGALKDLLNLKGPTSNFHENDSSCDAFISRYGPLREVPALAETMRQGLGSRWSDVDHGPRQAVRLASLLLQTLFEAHSGEKEQAYEAINNSLALIFGYAQIDGKEHPPGLRVDLLAGKIEPVPRDLLDAIALEFMRSYRMIGPCDRCRRFFFKSYPSDRYCSGPCSDAARSEAQRNWMRNKRAEQAEQKRKKESRKPKRRIQ
jgi:hypothetical protein